MLDAVAKHAHTGAIGDGKIWVSDVDSVLRPGRARRIATQFY